MASTPNTNTQDLTLTMLIKVNGSAISDIIQVEEIDIVHEINRISYAELVLIGGDSIASNEFPTLDPSTFNPGTKIEIQAGYINGTSTAIFNGIIVKMGVEINEDSLVRTKLFCKHPAVSMTYNREEAMFESKTDSQILTTILGKYSSISSKVDSTSSTQDFIFQKSATDWDFLLARAYVNGFVVTMDDTTFTVAKPVFSGTEILSIPLSEASVYSLEAYVNAEKKPASVKVSAWDEKTQALINATSKSPSLNSQGNLTPSKLSSSLSQTQLEYTTLTSQVKNDLQTFADSVLLQHQMSSFVGNISFIGNAIPKTGKLINITGIGDKFNGSAYVTGVTHHISDGLWKTTVSFGLDTKPVYAFEDFSYPAALGQLPGINGLQIATVTKISSDPKSQFRVQVTIPSSSGVSKVWARLAGFYATNNAGAFFYPEIGDEVVLGFIDADTRYPIILGSMYSSSRKSTVNPSDDNNYIKSLTTKSNLIIQFDDQNKVIQIKTPGGNSVEISDKDKSISLKDQNSNSIVMNSSGITLESAKDINIKATGNISLKATGKLNAEATGDAVLKGLNVTAQGQVGFVGKGSATAEVSASGQTTVKGAIVMIN